MMTPAAMQTLRRVTYAAFRYGHAKPVTLPRTPAAAKPN